MSNQFEYSSRRHRALSALVGLAALPLLAAAPAVAQEAPQSVDLAAQHSLSASVDNGDGTYAVTYQVTLTNNSPVNLTAVSLTPMPAKAYFFISEVAPLEAAALSAGASATVAWTISLSMPGDAGVAQLPILFHGAGTDDLGASISVFAASRWGAAQ